jgi:hypothetical protein
MLTLDRMRAEAVSPTSDRIAQTIHSTRTGAIDPRSAGPCSSTLVGALRDLHSVLGRLEMRDRAAVETAFNHELAAIVTLCTLEAELLVLSYGRLR